MKTLQNILFAVAMVIGLTLSVSAQKDQDPKKTPPKDPPPVINPNEDKKPREKPKPETKPKKPTFAVIAWKDDESDEG